MSRSIMQTFGAYFLLWLFSVFVNCSAVKARNGLQQFGEAMSTEDNAPGLWYFAQSPFMITKKKMSEREINSLLRNAWLG